MVSEVSEQKILDVFKKCDLNGDGIISRSELAQLLKYLCPQEFDDKSCDVVLESSDKNKDGQIQYNEFITWLCQKPDNAACGVNDKGRAAIDYRSLLPERFEVDIASRYALDRLALGEGGYGKVFIAVDKEFGGQKVVVKKVTTFGSTERTDLFRQEIQVMKELDHPHICKLFSTFEQGSSIFYVMEFCEGGELFDRIINSGKISEALTADVIAQVGGALRYAHNRGIAHRDIKPENVVFANKDPNDTFVKLIDWGFGISFTNGRMCDTVGSQSYAAPEVISARGVTAYSSTCDLWSLGVLTYVMVVGRPAFWGTEKQHLHAARNEIYPFTGPPFDSLSDNCRDFIRSLLRADPANRLPIDSLPSHPWLTAKEWPEPTAEVKSEVLGNIRRFGGKSNFAAICISAVARQLDHKRLHSIYEVFRQMDKDGNGVLSYTEIQEGFGSMYGKESQEYKEVVETFSALDLDSSMSVDYTEFCAAGLGQHTVQQDEACWAAFKTFDTNNSGTVTLAELRQVLQSADLQKAWTSSVCRDVAGELLDAHDANKDGVIDFDEWKGVMRRCFERNLPPTEAKEGETEEAKEAAMGLRSAQLWAYDLLNKVGSL